MIQFHIQPDGLDVLHLQVDLITDPERFINVVFIILLCHCFLGLF